MRSLKHEFEEQQRKNPVYCSDYLNFAEAIKDRGFNQNTIRRQFEKLVDVDDYSKQAKNAVLQFLYASSNPSRRADLEVILT